MATNDTGRLRGRLGLVLALVPLIPSCGLDSSDGEVESGGLAMVTEEEVRAMREASCTGWTPDREGVAPPTVASVVGAECAFSLPEAPPGLVVLPETTVLVFSGAAGAEAIAPSAEVEDCREGIRIDVGTGVVTLCSRTCARLHAEPQATLEVLVRCGS